MIVQPGFISTEEAIRIDKFLRQARLGTAFELIDGPVQNQVSNDGAELTSESEEWPQVIGEPSEVTVSSGEMSDSEVVTQTIQAIEESAQSDYLMEFQLYYAASAQHPVPYGVYIPLLSYPLHYEVDHVVVKFNAEDVYGERMGDKPESEDE